MPQHDSSLDLGLTVLHDLVRHVRLPLSNAEEQCALLAIRALHGKSTLSEAQRALRDELFRAIELLTDNSAGRLTDWICARRWWHRLAGAWRWRRPQRHALLFLLLAKTVAPVSRFVILPILNRRGFFGTTQQLEARLSWIPRYLFSREELELALLYLEIARDVLAAAGDLRLKLPDEVAPREFTSWSWPRQLMHLTVWRGSWESSWSGHSENVSRNPVYRAGTLEFRLAGIGAFSRLGRRGGTTARHALSALGYADYQPHSAGRAWRSWCIALLLAGCSVALAMDLMRSIHLWDTENRAIASAIESALTASAPGEQ